MSESFTYIYSAERQSEIDAIRKKYLPPEEQENKLEQLRKLDASLTTGALTASMALGIASALVFGTGMCCPGGAFVRGRRDRRAGCPGALPPARGKAPTADRTGDPSIDRGTESKIKGISVRSFPALIPL